VDDRRLWALANPAVASGRGGGLDFLEEQLRRLGPAAFAQEHLGVWGDPPVDRDQTTWRIISKRLWDERATKEGDDAPADGWLVGPVALAVEMTEQPNVTGTLVVAGECREGGIGAEVVARGAGSSWIVGHVAGLLADDTHPISHVVIDPRGPARELIGQFEAAGITVLECPTPELVGATGAWISSCTEGGFVHRNSPELTESVSRCELRKYGESMLINRWADGDPTPVIAVALARWGHLQPVHVVDLAEQVF